MSREGCDGNTADDGTCKTDGERKGKIIIVGPQALLDFIIIPLRCIQLLYDNNLAS